MLLYLYFCASWTSLFLSLSLLLLTQTLQSQRQAGVLPERQMLRRHPDCWQRDGVWLEYKRSRRRGNVRRRRGVCWEKPTQMSEWPCGSSNIKIVLKCKLITCVAPDWGLRRSKGGCRRQGNARRGLPSRLRRRGGGRRRRGGTGRMRRDDRRSKGGRTCRISWTKRSLCIFISFVHHECNNDSSWKSCSCRVRPPLKLVVTTLYISEGGGFHESSEGGREEETGARAAAYPGGAGETAEEEGTRDQNLTFTHVTMAVRLDSIFLTNTEVYCLCLSSKRIEEIMKRTRKSEVEPLSTAAGSWSPDDVISWTIFLCQDHLFHLMELQRDSAVFDSWEQHSHLLVAPPCVCGAWVSERKLN